MSTLASDRFSRDSRAARILVKAARSQHANSDKTTSNGWLDNRVTKVSLRQMNYNGNMRRGKDDRENGTAYTMTIILSYLSDK